jgi:5'-nucleotidase
MKHLSKILLAVVSFLLFAVTATTTLAQMQGMSESHSEMLPASSGQACANLPASGVHLTIIHLNDVYEITPVSGGRLGGLSRVATLKEQLLAENPNTYLFFAGDMYGPSGLSTAMVDGVPLDGIQVVEVMNEVGVDYMTFGDHEFDQVSTADNFYRNLAATEFPVVSSNVFYTDGLPFSADNTTVAINDILTATNLNGDDVQIGLFGVTEPIPGTNVPLSYTNHISATTEQVGLLRDQVEILIALTHFGVATDIELANQFPQIDVIFGGDDHNLQKVEPVGDEPPIYKSDSNARNVYIVDLCYDTDTNQLEIEDRVQAITDEIADDPETKAVADEWVETAFNAFREQGIEPLEVIAQPTVDLDGFATSIRSSSTELTYLIGEGFMNAAPDTELALYISGFIRLDDLMPADSPFTRYDVIRTYPINGIVVSAEVTGTVIQQLLDLRPFLIGSGGYPQTSPNVSQNDADEWLINGEALDPNRVYQVATSNFDIGFLQNVGGGPIPFTPTTSDFQDSLIQQLRREFGLLQLEKTVGTDEGLCADSDSLSVTAEMTTVTYCYKVSNTTNITLTTHALTDTVQGTPVYITTTNMALAPGAMYSMTWSTTISSDTVNSAIWVASDGTMTNTISATDMATVTIDAPTAIDIATLNANGAGASLPLGALLIMSMISLVAGGYVLSRRPTS